MWPERSQDEVVPGNRQGPTRFNSFSHAPAVCGRRRKIRVAPVYR